MKFTIFIILCACLLTPVFSQTANSQDANAPVYQTLNESMSARIDHSTETLEIIDRLVIHDDQGKTFATYKIRFEALNRALQDSEVRMNHLLRFNANSATIRAERNQYASLLRQLETVNEDYNSWLRNIQ